MTSAPPCTRPKNRWVFAGVILMSLSLLLWVCLLGVPFLPLSAGGRGVVATARYCGALPANSGRLTYAMAVDGVPVLLGLSIL